MSKLAIFGGNKTRKKPMPKRNAFGSNEKKRLLETINYYYSKKEDPPYNGVYEKKLCKKFSKFMGGGFTLAVSSGTASLYIAIQSLELKKGSEVIVSPFFDAGPLSALIFMGLKPVIVDAKKNSLNTDLEQIKKKITKKTSAIILVHTAGDPLEIKKIIKFTNKKKIKVIEDCSQSPGAKFEKKLLGTFGDICCISTMFSKSLSMSGSGGLIFTNKKKYIKKIIGYTDRGKPSWKKSANRRDPSQYIFPALNWNINEFSCSVGLASLSRLNKTIRDRLIAIKKIKSKLQSLSLTCKGYEISKESSPYYYPIWVDIKKITCSKIKFAQALIKEGINLNPDYKFLCQDWKWAKKYLKHKIWTPNAKKTRDSTFNLYINENFKNREIKDVVSAILKVEKFYLKK